MRKVYLINTNRTNRPGGEDEQDMILNAKFAAYFSPWKEKIDHVQPNNLVFLYSNGKGIIARGIAIGVVEIGDYRNDEGLHKDQEHYMHLNRFERLKEPMPASKINETVGYSVVYGQTMVSMEYSLGLKVWQSITKNYL